VFGINVVKLPTVKAISPGKLILSGEHSVVYGKPSVAMAIDRGVTATIEKTDDGKVSFDLPDIQDHSSFTVLALQDFKRRVLNNYELFQRGELGIRDVLHKPVDLFKFGFITILDGLHRSLDSGVVIKLKSNLPLGSGLGSSAASVLSELRALGHYLRVDFKPEWYYEFSLEAEKLQHGHPSGVDSHISLYGGCAAFENGEAQSIPLPRMQMYLVETGIPEATTGECVMAVKQQFENDPVWEDFEAVTREVEQAVCDNNEERLRLLIRENHRLLCRIGVVPGRVQRFVADVEAAGGAAKICGAGSTKGCCGGAVLVLADFMPAALAEKYGYAVSPVRGDPLGTRIV
jgi:mevalonate kinase